MVKYKCGITTNLLLLLDHSFEKKKYFFPSSNGRSGNFQKLLIIYLVYFLICSSSPYKNFYSPPKLKRPEQSLKKRWNISAMFYRMIDFTDFESLYKSTTKKRFIGLEGSL